MSESRTIQLWPTGQSVTYRGEYPHYRIPTPEGWIEACPGEQREIHANVLAERFVETDIYCCDSSLVGDLIAAEHEGFTCDDIENSYLDPSDWDLQRCREYLEGQGEFLPGPNPWAMTRGELAEALAECCIETYPEESTETLCEAVIANIDDGTIEGIDAWREAVENYSQDNPQEAYEWWRISPWLVRKLRELGEIVIENGYGCWWGRGCTGQSMLMDGTLQQVALRVIDA